MFCDPTRAEQSIWVDLACRSRLGQMTQTEPFRYSRLMSRLALARPLHIHDKAAETFYVLAGEYIIYLDEHEVACPAGSFVYIPAGTRHGFRVGAVGSRKLVLFTPAAMLGYFDDLSDAIRSGHVDDEHLSQIALRYGMEVVGPVLENYT